MCERTIIIRITVETESAAASADSSHQRGRAQAEYQSKMAAPNARQARSQADAGCEAPGVEANQHRRQVGQPMRTQRSWLAAFEEELSDADSSAMSILGEVAQWGEYDAHDLLYQGELKAHVYKNQASGLQADAAMYGRGAKQAGASGAIGG